MKPLFLERFSGSHEIVQDYLSLADKFDKIMLILTAILYYADILSDVYVGADFFYHSNTNPGGDPRWWGVVVFSILLFHFILQWTHSPSNRAYFTPLIFDAHCSIIEGRLSKRFNEVTALEAAVESPLQVHAPPPPDRPHHAHMHA